MIAMKFTFNSESKSILNLDSHLVSYLAVSGLRAPGDWLAASQ